MKPFLGANGDTNNGIGRIVGNKAKDRRSRISVKRFLGVGLGNFDTIGAAVNICAVLPERQKRILHEEIHAGQEAIVANMLQSRPVIRVGCETTDLFVRFGAPRRIFGIMEVKTPRASR